MLTLYHAADLETLGALACRLLAQPLREPLAATPLVTPSRGLGRWLTLRLAREQGIAMHLDIQLPAAFMQGLALRLLDDQPQLLAFDPQVLTWRIYDWLWEPDHQARAEPLHRYLQGGDERRRFSLAGKIAEVFQHYQIYRDDWLSAWETGHELGLGPDEGWQALLWRDTSKAGAGRPWPRLLARLRGAGPIAGVPERLVAFGFSSLAPLHLEILEGLARHTEVVLFALNPCREAWGDIRDLSELAKESDSPTANWYLDVGNPLLASLGKQGREFFDRLFAATAQETGIYANDAELRDDGLLHVLQNDILRLRQRSAAERFHWRVEDRSLEVHVAHSPLREVQILHDQLLARFADDPSLTPDQVVVLTPDIERYAPFVETVFAGASGPKIPYSLADRNLRSEFPLVEAFLALLQLPQSRFAAEDIIQLLEQPAIARRAGIEGEDLPLLRDWLRQAGVHWAWNGQQQVALGLPEEDTGTWQQGLDRLLLGFAAPPQLAGAAPPLLADLPPLDLLEGAAGQLLGRLHAFVAALAELSKALQAPRPLAEWSTFLQQTLDDMVDEREAGDVLLAISRACAALGQQAEAAGIQRPLPLDPVRQQLAAQWEGPGGAGGFLTGALTFCALLPMRSLPFRLVCVLGLDDGTLPRQNADLSFDLTRRRPRSGDRARRLDDRYLFLETLLSARQALYLSYLGRSPRDNSELPPSVLVSELLQAVDASSLADDGRPVSEHIRINHPMQPFAAGNFTGGRLRGFSATWFLAAERLAEPAVGASPWFSQALPAAPEQDLEVGQLLQCFRHPARYLLKERLGLRLPEEQEALEQDEPFEIDRNAEKGLKGLALKAVEQAWDEASERRLAAFAGLPTGALGLAAWERLRGPVRSFAGRLLEQRPQESPMALAIDRTIAGARVRGWLPGVTSQGLFDYRLRELGPWELAPFWLCHLLLNLCAGEGVAHGSRLLSPQEEWRLAPLDNAATLLEPWIEAYRQALCQPLPLFAKASSEYAERILRPKKTPPLAAARHRWEGSEHSRGEREEPWNALAFRGLDPLDARFESLARDLYGPILSALQTTQG